MKALGVAALVALGGLWLLDVVTWHGLAYSLGFGDGVDLLWPAGTRAVTLILLVCGTACGTLGVVAYLDVRDAVYEPDNGLQRTLVALISLQHRTRVRITWWWGGVVNGRRQMARAVALARPILEAGRSVHAIRDEQRDEAA